MLCEFCVKSYLSPPATIDFQHRGHKDHRDEHNREIRNDLDLPPVTCYLLPVTLPLSFPPLGSHGEPGFAPFSGLAIAAAFLLRPENDGWHWTWIAALIEGDKRQKSRRRVFPFSLIVVFRKHFDAHF